MCLNSYAVSLTLTLLLLPSLNNLSSCWDRQSIRSSSPPTSIPSLTNPWVPSYQQLHSTEASQWHQLRTHLHHSIAIGPVGAATTTDKTSAPHNHFNPHHQPSSHRHVFSLIHSLCNVNLPSSTSTSPSSLESHCVLTPLQFNLCCLLLSDENTSDWDSCALSSFLTMTFLVLSGSHRLFCYPSHL
jgi:hypothetical protein